MDNASKALIMAGAILIALVIVSVGVSLLSTPRDTVSQAQQQLDAQQIVALNSQLTAYRGDTIKGSQVKALIDTIAVINTRDTFPEDITCHKTTTGDGIETGTLKADIIDNNYYSVTFEDVNPTTKDGVYDKCVIEGAFKSTT